MSPDIGETPPERTEDWSVTGIGRRTRWGPVVQDCDVCGDPVDLEATHRYVQLGRFRDGISQPVETDDLVFCSPDCFDEWR